MVFKNRNMTKYCLKNTSYWSMMRAQIYPTMRTKKT